MTIKKRILGLLILTTVVGAPLWARAAADGQPAGAGFLTGLWHGLLWVERLIADIFIDVDVVADNNSGWPYYMAFVPALLAGAAVRIGVMVTVVAGLGAASADYKKFAKDVGESSPISGSILDKVGKVGGIRRRR